MKKVCLPLLLAVGCATPDDPGWEELAAERDRLRELREQVDLVPADVMASRARLLEALGPLPTMGSIAETTRALTDAIQHCGGTVHQLTPATLTHDVAFERQEVTVTFHGLNLGVAVCTIGRMAREPRLIFTDTFECTRPHGAVSCTLTAQSTRFDDTRSPAAPPPLPADATSKVEKLHAEVTELWEQTSGARDLVALAKTLEAQLDTTERLLLRRAHDLELANSAEAVAQSGLQPGRFAFDGETLSVEGTVPAESARAELAAIRSTEHVAIQLGELRVDTRLAPVDVGALPVIATADKRRKKKKRSTVLVHAVDAEAMWLYSVLAAGEESVVSTTVRGQLVTGRIEAATARDARRSIKATQPGLAIRGVSKKSLRGKGRKVTLEIMGGRTPQLFDLLGNILGVSIAAPHDLPDVTVILRNTPADGVVRSLASLLEVDIDKRSGVWLLTPRSLGRMPRGRGPVIDFSAVGITAAQGLAILDTISPTGIAVPCDSATAEIWLKNVSHGDASGALLVNVGLPWPSAGASGCRDEIPHIELNPVELLGLAFGDAGAVALAKDVGGAVRLIADDTTLGNGTTLSVTRLGVIVTPRDGEATTLNLRESWSTGEPEPEDLRGSRLAATVNRNGRSSALLETSNGDWQLIREGHLGGPDGPAAQCTIQPGRIEVTPTSGSAYTLRLRRRLGH